MKYLNLSASVDQHEQAMRARLDQLGAWLILQCYCHRQMNGGTIINCRDWPEDAWRRLGLTQAMVFEECHLWHFSGVQKNALVVHIYDAEAEAGYRRKQKLGKLYAAKRWEKKRAGNVVKISEENGLPIGSPNGSAMGHPMRKEGRKEGIGKP